MRSTCLLILPARNLLQEVRHALALRDVKAKALEEAQAF